MMTAKAGYDSIEIPIDEDEDYTDKDISSRMQVGSDGYRLNASSKAGGSQDKAECE